jgi:hypothetical protein
MVVGFNHNFRYKGEIYHVQTEDSGRKSPHIITLLYKGGNILASRKTSYADICKIDNLEQVVEELMKEQHKEMLRRLKSGEFDALIESRKAGAAAPEKAAEAATVPAPEPPSAPPAKEAPIKTAASSPAAASEPRRKAAFEPSLDEIILSYLVGDDDDKDT